MDVFGLCYPISPNIRYCGIAFNLSTGKRRRSASGYQDATITANHRAGFILFGLFTRSIIVRIRC